MDASSSLVARSPQTAQTLGGYAVLLEIGAQLGVLEPLLARQTVSAVEAAKSAEIPLDFVAGYYSALEQAGLATLAPPAAGEPPRYAAAPDLQQSINDAGYLLWSIMSNAPLLWNARAFVENLSNAANKFSRNGEHVARTSRWMGEADFYPHAEQAIVGSRPRKIVDLGAGTCGLLQRLLRKLPEAEGVGIEINPDACRKASAAIAAVGLSARLQVIQAPIQSLVENPEPIVGAGAIHAGWVFHDLMPHEESVLDALLRTFRTKAPDAALVIVDGVPYASAAEERGFSASYTFLHSHFMGRKLQTESEWQSRLSAAGYGSVDIRRLGISGGRLFVAKAR